MLKIHNTQDPGVHHFGPPLSPLEIVNHLGWKMKCPCARQMVQNAWGEKWQLHFLSNNLSSSIHGITVSVSTKV